MVDHFNKIVIMKIPEQYNQLMPYLILRGSSSFQEFMKSVFDAEEQLIVPGEDGTVMHGELRVGEAVVMYAETGGQFAVMNAGMYIHVADTDATYRKALAAGADTVPGQEPSDKEYGRACGVKDPFGNVWWITSVRS
jgi:PhnB protein